MSPQLATVGLSVVPPVAALAIIYGRFVRKITVQVQVQYLAQIIFQKIVCQKLKKNLIITGFTGKCNFNSARKNLKYKNC